MSSLLDNHPTGDSCSSKNTFNSYFVLGMLFVLVVSSLFNRFSNDPVWFKIGWTNYTASYCRRYIAYAPKNSALTADERFRTYYYHIMHTARKKILISNVCDSLGLVISDNDMRDSIINDLTFYKDGGFSRAKFIEHIAELGVSEHEFYELRREELRHEQFWYLLENSYPLPIDLVKKFNRAYNAVRHIRFAKVDHADIKLKYSEADLLNFYKKNKSKFKSQPKFSYDVLAVSVRNFSDADRVFLNRVIKNNNFDSIMKNYPNDTYSIPFSEFSSRFKSEAVDSWIQAFSSSYREKEVEVGDCLYFSADEKFYVLRVTSIQKAKQIPFSQAKDSVKRLYENVHKPKAIDVNSLKWQNGACSVCNYRSLNLPSHISAEIFSLPIGVISSFRDGGCSYFVVLDSISEPVSCDDSDDFLLRGFLNKEIREAIASYLLSYAS